MSAARDEELAGRLGEYFRAVRQGHVFSRPAVEAKDADQVVVISQTCDVVLPKRPSVTVARVVHAAEQELQAAQSGDSPRYVSLPELGGDVYADLSYVETFEKAVFQDAPYVAGIDLTDEEAKRKLSLAVGRWFSRFPFPNELVPWLQPIEKLVRAKYDKPASPLGKLLREVIVDIRVEAGSWQSFPTALELHVVARAEALPTLPEEPLSMSDTLRRQLYTANGTPKSANDIAQVYDSATDADERGLVLGVFAEACAALCTPSGRAAEDETVAGAVNSVTGTLWADDEFPLSRVRKSEPLDLDYLSEPTPFGG